MFLSNKNIKIIATMTLGLMSLKPVTALAAVYHSEQLSQGRSSVELTLASDVDKIPALTDQEQILQDYKIQLDIDSVEFSDLSLEELDNERAGFPILLAIAGAMFLVNTIIAAVNTAKTVKQTGNYSVQNGFSDWLPVGMSAIGVAGSVAGSMGVQYASLATRTINGTLYTANSIYQTAENSSAKQPSGNVGLDLLKMGAQYGALAYGGVSGGGMQGGLVRNGVYAASAALRAAQNNIPTSDRYYSSSTSYAAAAANGLGYVPVGSYNSRAVVPSYAVVKPVVQYMQFASPVIQPQQPVINYSNPSVYTPAGTYSRIDANGNLYNVTIPTGSKMVLLPQNPNYKLGYKY